MNNKELENLYEMAEQSFNGLKLVNDKINNMPRDQYDKVSKQLRDKGIHYNVLDDAMKYLSSLGSVVKNIKED